MGLEKVTPKRWIWVNKSPGSSRFWRLFRDEGLAEMETENGGWARAWKAREKCPFQEGGKKNRERSAHATGGC